MSTSQSSQTDSINDGASDQGLSHISRSTPSSNSSSTSTSTATPITIPSRKTKNMKKLSLSTLSAQKRPTFAEFSSSLPATPVTGTIKKSMTLPMLDVKHLSAERSFSSPDIGDGRSPIAQDRTFSGLQVIDQRQPFGQEDWLEGREQSFTTSYNEGPVCIIPPNLWLFSEPTLEEACKFDLIINCAKEVSSPFRQHPHKSSVLSGMNPNTCHNKPCDSHHLTINMFEGFDYVHLPWEHNQAFSADLPLITEFLNEQINNAKRRVLIHCQQGVSRSASLVIAFVMREKRMDLNAAYAYVKSKSPGIGPNMSLIYQLCEWERIASASKPLTKRHSFASELAHHSPGDRTHGVLDIERLSFGVELQRSSSEGIFER